MDKSLSTELPGTVKIYDRHFFVSTSTSKWAPRIESDEGLLEEISEILMARTREEQIVAKLTAFYDAARESGEPIRILCFPDLLKYQLQRKEFADWVNFYFSGKKVSDRFVPEPLSGRWLFVCIHASRDERCGNCGPPLLEALREAAEEASPAERYKIYGCSHTGGHKYAGNVLVYPEGDWYGLLDSAHARSLLDHLRHGKIAWKFWRGRAGLDPAEQAILAKSATGDGEVGRVKREAS